MKKQRIDLVGKGFGLLQVVAYAGSRSRGGAMWECICACGTRKVIDGANLRYGRTNSCGCNMHAGHRATHQMSHTSIHNIWCGMRQRCENPNPMAFADFGGRGIQVCERWQAFENFLADMGVPPTGMSIDRIDNDGGYSPENCRWASQKEQVNNRRTTLRCEFGGVTRTLKEWADETGLPYKTLHHRYAAGKREHDLFAPLRGIVRRRAPKALQALTLASQD